jgi:hypothetical protein
MTQSLHISSWRFRSSIWTEKHYHMKQQNNEQRCSAVEFVWNFIQLSSVGRYVCFLRVREEKSISVLVLALKI